MSWIWALERADVIDVTPEPELLPPPLPRDNGNPGAQLHSTRRLSRRVNNRLRW